MKILVETTTEYESCSIVESYFDKITRLPGYSEYDGIRGKGNIYYAIDHVDGGWFKTTYDNYINGISDEENEPHLTDEEVYNELVDQGIIKVGD